MAAPLEAGPGPDRSAPQRDSPLDVASVRQEIIENFEAGGRFQVTESHDDKRPRTPRDERRRKKEEEEAETWSL